MSKLDEEEDDILARNTSPDRDISPVSSSDSEVEVEVDDSRSSPLPMIDMTRCAGPPQSYQKRSKNSESFSVDALLGPDIPRQRNKLLDHNHSSYQPSAFAETIAVTRSLLYPGLSDATKDGKEFPAVAVLPRRSTHNFDNIPHGLYSMRLQHKNVSSPSGTPIQAANASTAMAVSYTHLTLPTIYSV